MFEGDKYVNRRADAEIAGYQKMRESGKKGIESRWAKAKTKQIDRVAIGGLQLPNEDPNSNHEPVTSNHKNKRTIASSDESLLAVGSIPVQGGEFIVYSDFAAVLEEAYPAVDVAQTLKEISAWCITNPTKKKTKRGAPAFINRWFAKEQNRG